MAYNNVFPANYGFYQPPAQPQMQPQMQDNPLIWVQGEAGAKSYLVGANKTVPLWDSEAQTIYLKSADASGMPSMKVLDYTIRESSNLPHTAPIGNKVEYVTKEELEALKTELESIKEKLGA
ncbi:hypothetical protein [Butyrivibrio virus Ceridwen]|nr:hypothetical protein [Butyrivibrio virus Ceridwen]